MLVAVQERCMDARAQSEMRRARQGQTEAVACACRGEEGAQVSSSGVTAGRKIFRRWRFLGFEYRSDLISQDYMRRWTLKTPWGMLRLHHILRSDHDRHFHDHPMSFASLTLKGGYIEYRPGMSASRFEPGSVVVRRGEDLHRLELLEKDAWTLVVTTPIYRDWGFLTDEGWVLAGEYDAWKQGKEVQEARLTRSTVKEALEKCVRTLETTSACLVMFGSHREAECERCRGHAEALTAARCALEDVT